MSTPPLAPDRADTPPLERLEPATPTPLPHEQDAPTPVSATARVAAGLMRAQRVGFLLVAAAAGAECLLGATTGHTPTFHASFGVLSAACAAGVTGHLLAPRPPAAATQPPPD